MVGRALSIVALVVVGLVAAPSPASADEGLVLSSESVIRLEPTEPVVLVESTYRMTNVQPDRPLGDGRFEYYFYTGLTTPLLPGATDVTVEVDGRTGAFTIGDDDGFRYVDVDLGRELRYEDTATVVVRSLLRGDEPRDEDSWVRVNPAYASFDVWGWGDPGRVDIRIEIPVGWVPEYVGDDLAVRSVGDVAVFEAVDIADPLDWGVLFTARNDELLETSRHTVGDAEFVIRSWPGDAEWLAFAGEQIAEGVPALERLFDTPWPVAGETEIVEASTPYLTGYAGFYDADDDVIEIGEDLDRQVFLHELAHAWVNGEDFAERWIIEGLTEEVASRAVAALGDELPLPRTDEELRSEGVDFTPFPLNTWVRFAGIDDEQEDYGYSASARVLRALGDEIGASAMTELVRALLAGDRAYPDESGRVPREGPVDWRAFLDLSEQVGGSEQLAARYRELVVTDIELDQLDRRAEVLPAYEQLLADGGAWYPPAVVRDALATWQFGRALQAIDDAEAVLDRRDDLEGTLEPLGLTSPTGLEVSYQDERRSLLDLHDRLDELTVGAEALAGARTELTEVLTSIGQIVPPLTQADYEAAPDAAAATANDQVDAAAELAFTIRELELLLDSHDLTMPPLDDDAFAVDADAARVLLAERLDAAAAVADVHEADDAATSSIERLGRWGSDVDADVDRLDALLADGEIEPAIELAAALEDEIDGFDTIGRQRLAIAIGATVLVLVAIAGGVLVRRRATARATVGGATGDGPPPLPGSSRPSSPGWEAPGATAPPSIGDDLDGTHDEDDTIHCDDTTPRDDTTDETVDHDHDRDHDHDHDEDRAESGDGPADLTAGEADVGEAGSVDPLR